VGLVVLGLGLSGCITVKTTVQANGSVVRRYEVLVRPMHQDMARQELQNYLGKGWKKLRIREISVDKTEISAERKFRDARELPYVRAQVHGPQPVGWLHLKQQYVYEETLSMGLFLPTERERQVVQSLPPVTYQLTLPGVIQRSGLGARPEEGQGTAGQPAAKEARPATEAAPPLLSPELESILSRGQPGTRDPQAPNTVSWSLPFAEMEGRTLVAVSERWNYARLVSLLVAVLVVLTAAAYVLSPLWRWIGRKLKERAAIPPEERERRRREKEEQSRQRAQERAAQAEERERRRREKEEQSRQRAQERAAQAEEPKAAPKPRWRWRRSPQPPPERPEEPAPSETPPSPPPAGEAGSEEG